MPPADSWERIANLVKRGCESGGLEELRRILPQHDEHDLVKAYCYGASFLSAWARVIEVIDDEMLKRGMNVAGMRAVAAASMQNLIETDTEKPRTTDRWKSEEVG